VDETNDKESGLKPSNVSEEKAANIELVVEHVLQDAEVDTPLQGASENHLIRRKEGGGPPGQAKVKDILCYAEGRVEKERVMMRAERGEGREEMLERERI
jgi:hypothetical protein